MINLFYTVCPNGQGHIKRSVAIANELVRQQSQLSITWFVSQKAEVYIKKHASTQLSFVSTIVNFSDQGSISLKSANQASFWSNYSVWKEQLFSLATFQEADLVVSDNIGAPLERKENTVLTGSFLWSEILENTSNNIQVIEYERNCLKANKPHMLYQAGFGMPYLSQYTSPVAIPWFTDKMPREGSAYKNVLITSGRSGADVEPFVQLVKRLQEKKVDSFFVDETLFNTIGDSSLNKFSFSAVDFSQLGCIICRPGMGIITEAVKYEIPLLTFSSFHNPELAFNASQISKLGLGFNLEDDDTNTIIGAMNDLRNTGKNRDKTLLNLKNQQVGGASHAAGFILDALSQ